MQGTVIRSTGSWYTVMDTSGNLLECRIRGKLRLKGLKTTNPVAVGDLVLIDMGADDDAYMIYKILPRDNYIIRQSPKKKFAQHIIAANMDQAFIIVTIAHPRTSTGFIDRFLVTAEAYHIPTVIIFNKQDIYTKKEKQAQEEVVKIYRDVGYQVELVSSLNLESVAEVKERMIDKTTLIAGHSGVGKSTFINAVLPGVNISTREISGQTGKGKHTTTFAEMFELQEGGWLIDTPGIKEFGVLHFEPEEISHYYPEMRDRISGCKFHNCLHLNEPKCAIKAAVKEQEISATRYKNYCNIVNDAKEAAKSWE